MAGGAVIHKLAPLRCVAAGPLRSLMNNCETDIGELNRRGETPPEKAALRGQDREELYRRRSAHLRAIALLREWLSSAQREQYERTQHFDVLGSASGRRSSRGQPGRA